MRSHRLFVLGVLTLFCFATVAFGQDEDRGPRRRGGGGFGFFQGGGMGGMGMGGKLGLLRMDEVQTELELDDDQKEQVSKLQEEARGPEGERPNFREMSDEEREKYFAELRERMQKADEKLGEILLPHQADRLEQLSIQQRGVNALSDPQVAEKLSITEEQKEKFTAIQEETREKMADLRELFQSDREQAFQKMAEMNRETEEKLMGVLTDEQRQQFEELKGEKFEFPRPQFGGPGSRRGNRPNRGDRPQSDN